MLGDLQFKNFFDIVTAGRHRGLINFYNKNNLFRQSALEREVQLRNTHTVFFNTPHGLMQVFSLSARIKVGRLVSKRNICSLRSFTYWFVARNSRSITLLYKRTQKLSSPQVLQWLSHKRKNRYPQSCPEEFIRFLWESTVDLLKKTSKAWKNIRWIKLQSEARLLSASRIAYKRKKNDLVSEEGFHVLTSLLFPSLTLCFDMENLVLVPASVYKNNQCLNSETDTKHQVEWNPTYQINSPKK